MSRAKISRMSGEHMVAEWVWVKFGRAVIFLHGIHYRLRCFCPHHHKPWRPFLALRLINQAWVREAHVLTTLSNRGITSFRKAKKQITDASPHIVPWSCMLFSIHASTKKQPPLHNNSRCFHLFIFTLRDVVSCQNCDHHCRSWRQCSHTFSHLLPGLRRLREG